jgi:ABC-type dipeptide/oligopeptide/nickel transport system ATPase component
MRLCIVHSLPGGSIDLLRPLLNVRSDDDFSLIVAWLLTALNIGDQPPILALCGESGSGKSMCTAKNFAPLLGPHYNIRSLLISANNCHVIAYDNMSSIRSWMRAALRRIAPRSAAIAYRDAVVPIQPKPMIINGINDVVVASHLSEFATSLRLSKIQKFKTESEMWNRFADAEPYILGALLDACSLKMRETRHASGRM